MAFEIIKLTYLLTYFSFLSYFIVCFRTCVYSSIFA